MKILHSIYIAGLFALLPSTSQAVVITEDFNSGYPGTAEGGWARGWIETEGSGTSLSATISSAEPLGAGNYLTVSTTATGSNSATVNRAFDSSTGLNPADSYEISYEIRLDSAMTSGQQLLIYAATGPSSTTSSFVSWSIVGDATAGWLLNNGNKAGGVTSQVSTGVSMVQDVVYSFTVTVNPTEKTWSVSIASTAGNYSSEDTYGFRTASETVMESPALSFGAKPGSGNSLDFSIDSIAISQIPEGAHMGLLMAILALGWLVRRRLVR
ncbi:MAG: hypothetical protein Q7Q73_09010 [Verrucomicrobiota bacterium JB024]|nr:hypothetical protein [Verrucomicrobiota bacterium JB024]